MIGFALLGRGRIGTTHARNIAAHSRAELDHFVGYVEHGAAPLAGFAEGREALRMADAALESLRTGRAVRVEPVAEAQEAMA